MAWFNAPATGDGRVWIDADASTRSLFYEVDFTAKSIFATTSYLVVPSVLGYLTNNLMIGLVAGVIASLIWTPLYWVYTDIATKRFLGDVLGDTPLDTPGEEVDPSVV